METCASALADAVGTHRVGELVEDFAFLDKTVDKFLCVLVMNIIIACAMNKEEVAFETIDEVDRTTTEVAIRIALWSVHVTLLIDGVVEMLVAHEGDGDTCLEDIWIAEHAVESLCATTTPTCDAEASAVHPREHIAEGEDAACLVFARSNTDLTIDALAPFASAWGCCAAVLDADDDKSLCSEVLPEE